MQEQVPDLVCDRESVPEHVLGPARGCDDDRAIDDDDREGVDGVDLREGTHNDDDAPGLRRGDQVLDRAVGQVPVPAQENGSLRRRGTRRGRRQIDFGEPDVTLERERQFPHQRRRGQRFPAVAHPDRPQAAEVRVERVHARQRPTDSEEARADIESLRQTVEDVGAR